MTTHKEERAAEKAKGDVQKQMDEEQAKGYFGTVPDQPPNEAYTLQTGPDSPSAVDAHDVRMDQPTFKTKEG